MKLFTKNVVMTFETLVFCVVAIFFFDRSNALVVLHAYISFACIATDNEYFEI